MPIVRARNLDTLVGEGGNARTAREDVQSGTFSTKKVGDRSSDRSEFDFVGGGCRDMSSFNGNFDGKISKTIMLDIT